MFAADSGGTAAWAFESGKLVSMWKNRNGGTSPVVAGGLLYVYSPEGGLRVYDPVKGTQIVEWMLIQAKRKQGQRKGTELNRGTTELLPGRKAPSKSVE